MNTNIHFFAALAIIGWIVAVFLGIYALRFYKTRLKDDDVLTILNKLPIAIKTYDKKNRLNFINHKAEELLGYTFSEIKGFTPVQIADLFWKDKNESLFNRLMGSNHYMLHKIRTIVNKRGEEIKLTVSVYKLDGGGLCYLFSDTRQEQQFQDIQLQTRTILDSVENCIVIAGTDNEIISVNKAFQEKTGVKHVDIIGKSLIYLNELLSVQPNHVDKGTSSEVTLTTMTGDKLDMVINEAPIYNVYNDPIGRILVGSDVTELRAERQKVQQQEKLALLGQMASGIVHEIRNPLTTIKGFNQLIESKLTNESLKALFNLVQQSVNDINKVVSDFLSFAKPQPPKLDKVSLNQLVKSVEPFVVTTGPKTVQMQMMLSADERPVLADEIKIKQVLINIIKNAVEASNTEENGTVIIATELDKAHGVMKIQVFDNGSGIPPKNLSKVGTPFFTTKAKGTGLGLSISRQIICEHDGKLEIESEDGRGTKVILSFPIFKG